MLMIPANKPEPQFGWNSRLLAFKPFPHFIGFFFQTFGGQCDGFSCVFVDRLIFLETDVLVRLERLDGTTQIARLTPDKSSFVVEAAPGALEVVRTYLALGVEHILLGVDHLLFVFALLILVKGWRRLVGTISAFTVAHSITLAAATLGFVSVPIAPMEAVIALSIAFVACEIIHRRQGRSGLTERWPCSASPS